MFYGLIAHFLFVGVSMSLESLISATLAGLGYELVDMSMSAKSGLLRVFIDKPAGISIEDCTVVSNHLSNWLVVENIAYERLEISSPGMDRPLRNLAAYQRFMGEQVQVKLRVALAGQRRFIGALRGASDAQIELEVEGEVLKLDVANIDITRLVPNI
jgi:ribosome maturation factor RimP